MGQKILYLDCRDGISSSLWLAALLDLGLPPEEISQLLETLSLPPGEFTWSPLQLGGVRGMQSRLSMPASNVKGKPFPLSACISLLQSAPLASELRLRALSILQHLFAVEETWPDAPGKIPPPLALIEIVSVLYGLQSLGISQIYVSALPLTGGFIQTLAGLQSFPSPVTLALLQQVPAHWQPSPLQADLVTPVAAALLAELVHFEQPVMTIAQTASGLYLDPEQQLPRRLVAYLGEQVGSEPTSDGIETDQITVIETHIDTMTGELLGALLDRLLAAGALDVGYTPLQMKKNRPGTRLTVICPDDAGERLAQLLLRETNTLGVRIQHVQRRKAQRRQERIETPLGPILVKIKSLGGQIISVSPEYEDCLRIANQQQLPLADVYEVARTAAQFAIIQKKKDEKEKM
jgi:uncharacterized protein (DUF111 family)